MRFRFPHLARGQLIVPGLHNSTFTESCDAACAERIPGEGGVMPMLSFNFILGLNFLFFCFKIIIVHYRTQKQKIIKFKPRIKLNHNTYIY